MARYTALLRGINLAGRRKVPMARLRELLEGLGYEDVATLLQSGNAVFATSERGAAKIAGRIEAALADDLGFDVTVMVRTEPQLAKVIEQNPFPEEARREPSKLLVAFLDGRPAASAVAAIDPDAYAPDRFEVVGDVIYTWYPNGAGRSKLGDGVWRKHLGGIEATARNWNTVTKLHALLKG